MLKLTTNDTRVQAKWNQALTRLTGNVVRVFQYDQPVLIEGSQYQGIWLECGPHEGLCYAAVDPRIAVNNHRVFFARQHPDGQFPAWIRVNRAGYNQIQMAVPIAATAYELALLLRDDAFLSEAYTACSRWDQWLSMHRNTRGTGLCEAFCEFDTGHDLSPRWTHLPRKCPDDNAANLPQGFPELPYLAPDLSSTVYAGRRALAAMAHRLGRADEAAAWNRSAEAVRHALMQHCFDADSCCFYDRLASGRLLKIRGDAMLRVLMNHVPDQALADQLFTRHVLNPQSFWTAYPLPSIAIDDPMFDPGSMSANAWAGASQALMALRATRWFEHYGYYTDLQHLLDRWLSALLASPGFPQQVDPRTGGDGSRDQDYSPAMLTFIECIQRRSGVYADASHLYWTVNPSETTTESSLDMTLPGLAAQWTIDAYHAIGQLNGSKVLEVQGCCRVITDWQGTLTHIIGVAGRTQAVHINHRGTTTKCTVEPNQVISVAHGAKL